jgi:hypothetical protein
MAQVVEYLLSKCETLSSNPNTDQKKRKKSETEKMAKLLCCHDDLPLHWSDGSDLCRQEGRVIHLVHLSII